MFRRHPTRLPRKRTCLLHLERLEERNTPATPAPGLEVTTYFSYTAGAANGPTDFAFGQGGLFADDRDGFAEIMAIRHLITNEVNSLIEPDARLLRRSPMTATRLLMSLVAGPPGGHLGLPDEPLADDEIVSIVLDGLLIRPQQTHPWES